MNYFMVILAPMLMVLAVCVLAYGFMQLQKHLEDSCYKKHFND